ncbi:MAG: M3 family metallopeptidase [Bacteroidetes bacterium]|nr:M3 family metallopeptidase [Bacteroidota bacterium]
MQKLLLATLFIVLCAGIPAVALAQSAPADNPFFAPYGTPFETPPFERIQPGHYVPAFKQAMDEHKQEIHAITMARSVPTFANTIEALDRSGTLLDKVSGVFGALRGAITNDQLDSIANIVTPLLTSHRNDIALNEQLFQRIKAVYDAHSTLALNPEQSMLLDNTYKDFVRGGANLSPADKVRLRGINDELSMLSLKFNQNLLKETNTYKMVVEKAEDLDGLPPAVVATAAETARRLKLDGKWVFTLQKPSWIPFLQYAKNRTLRETLYRAYCNRGDNNNAADNKQLSSRIAALRVARAQLLGYPTHAAYVLEENMAKTPGTVYEFLNRLWEPALRMAQKERDALQAMVRKEGNTFTLAPWDWWYYAEKVKKAEYDLDEDALRPYFKMENVRKGAFDVASRLFGLQFIERKDIPKYADDVQVFEVKGMDGAHIGILFTDYFLRGGKRPGAWMGSFRSYGRIGDSVITPVVYNVGNFSSPAADKPALLSLEDVETLFHEFGHALYGLLSRRAYDNVGLPRDGIELPSQIMENWARHPDVMRSYARHYMTDEPIPEALVQKIVKSETFNQGFASVEYLAASILDLDWHTLSDTTSRDATVFERTTFDRIRLMPEIISRYRTPYFAHIFSGGYSAGYYSYIWAEVLDADAFEAFREKGLFDRTTAEAYRRNILERGGTEDPMVLYERFRGKKPTIEPLLKKRGLL